MRVAAIIPVFNEKEKIRFVLDRFRAARPPVSVIVVDDGSTDGVADLFATYPEVTVVVHAARQGIGSAIRDGIRHAGANGFEAVVVMAGNGKDDPGEIPILLDKLAGGYDYIQGSRFLPGGKSEALPSGRHVGIKALTLVWSLALGKKLTDVTNGFRAYRLALFTSGKMDIGQPWLDHYELEYYLHYHAWKHFRCAEVPVSKVYRFKQGGYSKIRPFLDWWGIVKPLVYLVLRIRR